MVTFTCTDIHLVQYLKGPNIFRKSSAPFSLLFILDFFNVKWLWVYDYRVLEVHAHSESCRAARFINGGSGIIKFLYIHIVINLLG